jgi:serine/threonine protein phosphatase 1
MRFHPAPGRLPAGRRVYAIGDVHGCDRQLAELHELVADDLKRRPCKLATLVHIGDYVDRGPDSAGVVRRIMQGSPAKGLSVVNLMGNHERTMLDALGGQRAAATDWLYSGGRPALESWGVDPESPATSWAEAIPAAEQHFLRKLELCHEEGGYFFAHAGVRPGISLHEQAAEDLLRIRHAFLTSEADYGAVVVHGHTPVRQGPEVYANRINIDTGAVFGRELTCLVLEEDRLAFMQA